MTNQEVFQSIEKIKTYYKKVGIASLENTNNIDEIILYDHHVITLNNEFAVLLSYQIAYEKTTDMYLIAVFENYENHPKAPSFIQKHIEKLKWEIHSKEKQK